MWLRVEQMVRLKYGEVSVVVGEALVPPRTELCRWSRRSEANGLEAIGVPG